MTESLGNLYQQVVTWWTAILYDLETTGKATIGEDPDHFPWTVGRMDAPNVSVQAHIDVQENEVLLTLTASSAALSNLRKSEPETLVSFKITDDNFPTITSSIRMTVKHALALT